MNSRNMDFSHVLSIYKKNKTGNYVYNGFCLANKQNNSYFVIYASNPSFNVKILSQFSEIALIGDYYEIKDEEFTFVSMSKARLEDSARKEFMGVMEYINKLHTISRVGGFSKIEKNKRLYELVPAYRLELDEQLEEIEIPEEKQETDINQIMTEMKKKFIAQEDDVDSIMSNIYANQVLIDNGDKDLISTSKTAILLDGPTGTGKTAIIKEGADKLNLPVVITKSTDYSTAGYVGSSLVDILSRLLEKANGDLELAQRGIVCMDEFDKLAGQEKERELVMKRAVQQDLLAFIGGSKYSIEKGFNKVEFDTTNLTFIAMGAFTDLLESKKPKKQESSLGFISEGQGETEEKTYVIEDKDYVNYGIERELVGRLHLKTHTNAYLQEDFKRILLESEISLLEMFIRTVNALGVNEVTYEDNFIDEVSSSAYELGFGARGLQKIFADIKNYFLMDIINKKIEKIHLTTEVLNKIQEKNVRKF